MEESKMKQDNVHRVKEWEKGELKFHIIYRTWNENVLAITPQLHPYHCGYVTFLHCPAPYEGYGGVLEEVDVHGGITYAEKKPDGSYTYGFDCAHWNDENRPLLQDIDWLTQECERMAAQIITLCKAW